MDKIELRAAADRLMYENSHNTADYNMLIEYIDHSEAIKPDKNWISVKDRLPEPYKNVLVFGNINGIVTYRVDYLDDYGRWFRTFYVTHWQHLPEPPKGE